MQTSVRTADCDKTRKGSGSGNFTETSMVFRKKVASRLSFNQVDRMRNGERKGIDIVALDNDAIREENEVCKDLLKELSVLSLDY